MGRAAGPVFRGATRLGFVEGEHAQTNKRAGGPVAHGSVGRSRGTCPASYLPGGHTSPAITTREGRDHRREEGCVLHHLACASGQDVPSDLLDRAGYYAAAEAFVNPFRLGQTT